MKNMSDRLLIDTYHQAIEQNLNLQFIRLLKLELLHRSLLIDQESKAVLQKTAL